MIKSKNLLPIVLLLLSFSTFLTLAEEPQDPLEPGDEITVDHLEYELLSETEATLLGYENEGEEPKHLTIPDTITYEGSSYTVTQIAELAFAGSETIETITIGSNIQTIGDYAFSECEALETIQIPAQVKTIGQGAFSGDEDLTMNLQEGSGYTYENGLLMKDDSILYADPAMEECSIPTTIKTIQPYAFQGCDYLDYIKIPATVTSIKESTFAECYGIERIHIENNPNLILEKNAFGQMSEEGIIYVDTPAQKQQVEVCPEAYPAAVKVVCSRSYQITYETNGGQLLGTPIKEGNSSEDIELPEPSREGYLFAGWCVDKACEQEPQYMIMAGNTDDITYYAKWEEEEEGTEEPENIDDLEEKEEQKVSESITTKLISEKRKSSTKKEEAVTTKDSSKEENTRQELSTEEQAKEAESTEQTTPTEQTTEGKTVISPDKKNNSDREINEEKQAQADNPASHRGWWVYALSGAGIVCILAGILLLLSAKAAKGRKGREHKDKKSHKPTALLLLGLTCLTAFSAQTQPNAATSVTSTKLVIRDNEKAYRENIGVNIGSTLKTCYIVFTPDNTTNQNVTLTTSNPSIATVTARKADTTTYADITGITEGVTTLTATAADGGSSYSCLVTVRTPIEEAEGELTESMNLKQSALDTATSFETTCVAGQRGRIKGSVGNYYYFDCPAGVLEKNYHVAYVPKNKVTIYANSITLNKESVTLNKGKKERLSATISPSVTTNQTVTYRSSDTSIATVTARGVVKAKGKGQATITASVNSRYMGQDTTRTAICQVTVTQPVKKLLLKPATLTLEKGKSKQLKAQIRPTSANDKTIEWSTSNENIATVDSNGKVTVKAEGKATITALNPASGKKKSCKVTVLDKDLYELTGETEMEVGKTYTFQVVKKGTLAKQAKKATASSNWIFTSSNPKIARVDKKTGKVTPLKTGRVTISCRQKGTHNKLNAPSTSILLTKAEKERLDKIGRFMILKEGDYRYIVGNTSEARKGLTFSSNHPDIANAGLDGKVTGYKDGICKIKTKLKYKTVTTDVYVYRFDNRHGIIDKRTELIYENERKKKTAILNPCDKVDILGEIGNSYYYVNQLNQAGSVIRAGLVKQKQVLLYSGKETRDYVSKMRKGSWKYMYYSNKEGRISSDHSPIQMVLVGNTVHIYVKFCYKGSGVNKKFTYTDENGNTTESKLTYKEVFEQGIKKYWGNEGYHTFKGGEHRYQERDSGYEYTEKDFEKEVTLRCEVHFVHNLLRDDNQIPVYIGGKRKDDGGSYWFWVSDGKANTKEKRNGITYTYPRYHFNDMIRSMNIPTNSQLSSNLEEGANKEYPLARYQKSCAHEFGHVLGLDDAYSVTIDEGYGEEQLVRMDIFFFEQYYKGVCIMNNSRDVKSSITTNELEMILLAYNNAQDKGKKRYSWQSYATYEYQIKKKTYEKYLRSKAITWKGEKVK